MAGLVLEDVGRLGRLIERAREDLAARLGRVGLVVPEPTVEPHQWRDSAMGNHPLPGEQVFHKPTAGYILRFNVHGVFHRYHVRENDGLLKYDSHVGADY